MKRFLLFAVLAMAATLARAATMEEEVRAVFDKWISTQNAHDLKGIRSLLSDSPDMLWISRGKPIWGRDAALKTLEEVGKQFDVTRERIRQIEAKALRKLRHPSRSERLKSFLDNS